MTDPLPIYDQIRDFALPYVEPLFLHDFLLRTGRSAETLSATGVFVRRKGQLYCVTCRHVVEDAKSPKLNHETSIGVLALALQHGAIVLGTSKQSCFASPAKKLHEDDIDVSIARIPWGTWETLRNDRKRVEYIDFDDFNPPDYRDFVSCGAIGFPDKLKANRDGRIRVNIVVAVAGTTRRINTTDATFQLHSELPEAHGVGFSGMSGGLVVGIVSRDKYVPIGVVFEGGPSGEEESSGSIVGARDIFLRCNLLTPDIFDGWLEQTDFPDIAPIFMGVVE